MVKRRLFILVFPLIFLLAFSSLASAEIIVQSQPAEVYNLGDSTLISMKVKTPIAASGVFYMDLICGGQTINFYKNGVSLATGEEKKLEASLVFAKSLIGAAKGKCAVKGIFENDYALTKEFILSDLITLSADLGEVVFTPGQTVLIEGNAMRESGQPANGFIDLEIVIEDEGPLSSHETIQNGFFSINLTLPEKTKAGKHLLKLTAYEEDLFGEKTNTGFANHNIDVAQVPSNLELILEKEAKPGMGFPIRAVLHDQTGESIESLVKITIKNDRLKLIQEVEQPASQEFLLEVAYNEKPAVWSVSAVSEGLNAGSKFSIGEKREIEVSLVNNTIMIKNTGNVFYEGSVMIKIGEENVPLDVSLNVDEVKEYSLSAPDGEYEIVVSDGSDEKLSQRVFLTGRTVSAKEKGLGNLFSFVWIFILLVFGITAYMFFNKGRKKTFFARMPKFLRRKEKSDHSIPLKKGGSRLASKNPAVVSLSIKGEKQSASVICLHIKNLEEIQGIKGGAKEVLQKIIDFAEDQKAMTYENGDNLFFILAPAKTRTFKNEKTALQIAHAAKNVLAEHNRLFKQKIDFGVSINNGSLVAKIEKNGGGRFMSMGNFITGAKRMASQSQGEILFSKEVGGRLSSEIKTEKISEDIYQIKEFREHNAENKKFIDRLVRKWDREESEKKVI